MLNSFLGLQSYLIAVSTGLLSAYTMSGFALAFIQIAALPTQITHICMLSRHEALLDARERHLREREQAVAASARRAHQ